MKTSLFLATLLLLAGCSEDRKARSDISEMEAKIEGLTQQLETAVKANKARYTELEGKYIELLGETRSSTVSLITTQRALSDSHIRSIQSLTDRLDTLQPRYASIDPSQKGFGVARNNLGSYLIAVEEVQPYLDGHKIKLRVGNLTAGMLTGVTVTLSYGPRLVTPPKQDDDPPVLSPLETGLLDPADLAKWKEDSLKADKKAKERDEELFAYAEARFKRKEVKTKVDRDIPLGTWASVDVVIAPSKPEELGALEVWIDVDVVRLGLSR